MPTISAGELMVAYEIHGKGPPLLMVHGFEGNRHSDDHFIKHLTDQFTVITYDQRDCGDTQGPDREYDTYQHAADAAALIAALGYGRLYVYGQSNGGVIAQALAIAHPDCVERLVLAVTTPGQRGPTRSAASVAAMQALINGRAPPASSPARFFAPGAYENRPELQQIFARLRAPRDPAQQRRRAIALEGYDGLDRLASIQASTLVIGAWYDQVIPAASSWMIAERIPNARLIVLEGLGHAITWEAPERVASYLRNFFESSG